MAETKIMKKLDIIDIIHVNTEMQHVAFVI